MSNDELERVEPFDLRTLRRYSPALLSGWMAEEPSLSQAECLEQAHDESLALIGRRLSRFMPGDSHRGLRYQTSIWVFAARYAEDRPPVRILVNGQTGETYGHVPLSWIKITLACIAGLGVLALLYQWLAT